MNCVEIPGIGYVSGLGEVFEKPLEATRSNILGRRNGFFVRVHGRVINLEDELFGLTPQDHEAWSRFALQIHADGLRNQLLASREGVRDSESVDRLRMYLQELFTICRNAFDSWDQGDDKELDLERLVSNADSTLSMEPFFKSLRQCIITSRGSFYIANPSNEGSQAPAEWLDANEDLLESGPFKDVKLQQLGIHAPALRYLSQSQTLLVNSDHPFVNGITHGGKNLHHATFFGISELLLESQLYDRNICTGLVSDVLRDRDHMFRLIAGQLTPNAAQVLHLLDLAKENSESFEQAVSTAFQVLGFEYQRNGGKAHQTNRVLEVRPGMRGGTGIDYRLVYHAKFASQPVVLAEEIDFPAFEIFRINEKASYGLYVTNSYALEHSASDTLDRTIESSNYTNITFLKLEHLCRLVRLHYRYGVTLTQIWEVLGSARTVPEVDNALDALKQYLEQHQIPMDTLLEGLESQMSDTLAHPNHVVVRAKNESLMKFEPERLAASLKAVERILGPTWLVVDECRSRVTLRRSADGVLKARKDRLASLNLLD